MVKPRYRKMRDREAPVSSNNRPKPSETPLDGAKLYFEESDSPSDWMPSTTAVLKMMLSIRFSAGLWSTIQDCDEVFNYWEPLHLLIFGKGLQTWEYSPLYAIRSYMYVGLHYLPAGLLSLLFYYTKIAIFVCTRCLLAAFCASAEFLLFKAVCERFSIRIGRLFLLFTIFATGMFISCGAFLPSSFSMVMNMFAIAFYLRQQWFLSISSTAVSALIGWPFAALLGLPVVLDLLFLRRRILLFIIYAGISGTFVCGLLIFFDSYYFGKFVLAPMNIVLYNVFTEHGPNLYGVEPFSFYVKNLVLNFNVAAPLALAGLPLAAVAYTLVCTKKSKRILGFPVSFDYWDRFIPLLTVGLSMFAWLAVFSSQEHKEERFLYAIYPLVSLFAAVGIDALRRIVGKVSSVISELSWLVVLFFICVSLSRSYALHRNFGAHIEVYNGLNAFLSDENAQMRDFSDRKLDLRVCVGKEWYRFPSSFFLPEKVLDKHDHTLSVRLNFLKSEFRGLLPKYYADGKIPDITKMIPTEMNDVNREEPSRYVSLELCDFVVDLDVPREMTTELEPAISTMTNNFRAVGSYPFLIPSKSHWFYRAFYVPFLTPKHTFMANYTLYVNVRF